jgi:hypothetical protein
MSLSAKTAQGFYTATAKESIVKIELADQPVHLPSKPCNLSVYNRPATGHISKTVPLPATWAAYRYSPQQFLRSCEENIRA